MLFHSRVMAKRELVRVPLPNWQRSDAGLRLAREIQRVLGIASARQAQNVLDMQRIMR